MALSAGEIKTAYPLPSYNYRVEIGNDTVSCTEISGLNIKFDTTTYKESPSDTKKAGPVVMYMPAQATATTLTIKKGVVRVASLAKLYQWIKTVKTNQVEKKEIYIRLLDEEGKPVITWTVVNAFPTQLDAPTFSATSNDAAIESMTLMADDVLISEN
ncbi:MAG TPA: phage tail protein [Polyangium sp.]|nr:phage tail protein [Polyangium sp.]